MSARAYGMLVLLALSVSCAAPTKGTIGAVLGHTSEGRLYLRDVPAGLAAEQAGLRAGDELLLIDGLDVRQLDSAEVHRLLSGEVGASLNLTVLRGEEIVRVQLLRTAARRHRLAAPAEGP